MNDTHYNTKMVLADGELLSITTIRNTSDWTIVNTTNLPDNLLADAVDFLTPIYTQASGGYVIFTDGESQSCFSGAACGHGAWLSKRLSRSMRLNVDGYSATKPHIVIYCPNGQTAQVKYPATSVYKKRGGFQTYANWFDELGNVLSHELRHLEQHACMKRAGLYRREWARRYCKSGSLEVDAEFHARKNTAAFRKEFGIQAPTVAGRIVTRGAVRLSKGERDAIVAQIGKEA